MKVVILVYFKPGFRYIYIYIYIYKERESISYLKHLVLSSYV